MQASLPQRTLTFLTWALVGLSAVYWALRLAEPAPSLEVALQPAAQATPVEAGAVVALLTGSPANAASAEPVSRRFELLGVVAEGRRGVALLSIDGQPAKPFLVGAAVDERLRLQAVAHRRAELADVNTGEVVQRLELPAQAPAQLPAGIKLVPAARP